MEEMGTIDAVRLADLDGDAKPEIVVQECTCCSIQSGIFGVVYSYSKGFSNPSLLWKLPMAGCGGGRSLTVGDFDGNGSRDVAVSDYTTFQVLNGATGSAFAASDPLGTWISSSSCRAVDIDGVAGDELVCILNISNPPATNQRRVFVLRAASSHLSLAWSHVLAPDLGGDVAFVDPVVDLDGDGSREIVVAGKAADEHWTTYVLSAATGVELARVEGQRLVGTSSLGAGGRALLLTAAGTDLSTYSFQSAPTPVLTPGAQLSGRTIQLEPDWALARTCSTSDRVVALI